MIALLLVDGPNMPAVGKRNNYLRGNRIAALFC